jgi:predicted metal-binding membrane protein
MLALTAAAWILLVAEPRGSALAHCAVAMPASEASFRMLLALNPPASLAIGWMLMLAAMMLPLLIAPVRHVYNSSFARRRGRAIALFVLGYALLWMAAGVMLMALALALRLIASESFLPIVLALTIAILWQFSPWKQRSLNRCHSHRALAAFGCAADIDALRFGLTHGIWCVASCCGLMFLPLLISRGDKVAMIAVSAWMLAERLERPMPPRWRVRGPGTALRMLVAQVAFLLLPASH